RLCRGRSTHRETVRAPLCNHFGRCLLPRDGRCIAHGVSHSWSNSRGSAGMVCRALRPWFRPRGYLALVGVDTTGRAAVGRVVPGQSSPCKGGGATERWGKRGHRELESNKWAAADLPAISVLRDRTVLRRAAAEPSVRPQRRWYGECV